MSRPPAVAASLDEVLRPDHLTAALGVRHPGVRVTAARALDVGHGVATRTALALTYAPGADAGLPERMFLKAGFEGEATAHLLASGLFLREARFYRELAPALPVPVPRCFYAGPDERTGQGVLLLEDMTGRAEFPGLGGALDPQVAAVFVAELAGLHAARWADGDAPDLAWLPDLTAVAEGPFRGDPQRIRRNLAGPRGDVAPAGLRDPDRVVAAFAGFAAWAATEPACLVHGDSHGATCSAPTTAGTAGSTGSCSTAGTGRWTWPTCSRAGSPSPTTPGTPATYSRTTSTRSAGPA
jgi:hypothetical protein